MDLRSAGRRDLAVIAVACILVSRFADIPLVWVIAVLVLLGVALATLEILGEGEPRGVPIESLILPAVTAGAALGGMRLMPVGLAIAPALLLAGVVLDRAVGLEARLGSLGSGPSAEDRTEIVLFSMLLAFVAFTGIGAIVPGGLAAPVAPGASAGPAPDEIDILMLAVADALVGALLGYRISALGSPTAREALLAAATYGIVIAISAGALRALGLPSLIGPAILTVVLFLWASLHDTGVVRSRDPRRLWEVGLLAVLGVLVIVLNLRPWG